MSPVVLCDPELDTLLVAYANANYDCGSWTDDEDSDEWFGVPYERVNKTCLSAREALYEAIRKRLGTLLARISELEECCQEVSVGLRAADEERALTPEQAAQVLDVVLNESRVTQ